MNDSLESLTSFTRYRKFQKKKKQKENTNFLYLTTHVHINCFHVWIDMYTIIPKKTKVKSYCK